MSEGDAGSGEVRQPLTPHIPMDVVARLEIWESFVSLLRSYAAAAGPEYSVAGLSGWVTVAYRERLHRFSFEPETGKAIWTSQWPDGSEAQGNWQLDTDGTADFGQGPEDLDMAAIDWISKLKRNEAGMSHS